jgi:hypothetical protein
LLPPKNPRREFLKDSMLACHSMGSAILLLATCNLRSYNTQVTGESADGR